MVTFRMVEMDIENINPNGSCVVLLSKIGALPGAVVIRLSAEGSGLRGSGLFFGLTPDNKTYYAMLLNQFGDFGLRWRIPAAYAT